MFLYDLWPFAIAIGLTLFVVSFLVPEATAVTVRVLSMVAFVFAIIAAFPIT